MPQARTYRPSEQRIADARRAGHVPRAAACGAAGAALGLSLGGAWFGASLWEACVRLFRVPLEQTGQGAALRLEGVLALLRGELAPALWALLACAAAGAGFALFLAQGLAVRWPLAPRVRQQPFEPLSPPRTSRVLAALGVLAVGLVTLHEALWTEPSSLGTRLAQFSVRLCFALGACALVDAALARAAHLRSLWMTRSEHRDALREAYGSPEIRATRERVRREAQRGRT